MNVRSPHPVGRDEIVGSHEVEPSRSWGETAALVEPLLRGVSLTTAVITS